MVYQGSKDKLAKYFLPIIHRLIHEFNISDYYELFMGGANLIDKVECANRHGYDYNDYVVSLLTYAQEHPNLEIAPADCPFEHYCDVRNAYNHGDYSTYTKEYIALVGYMASYGGRFFDGGYGRDSKGGRSIYAERLANLRNQAPNLAGIDMRCQPYDTINPQDYANCLFYLDPPYRDTKPYARQSINYDHFYDFCRNLAEHNFVLVSEFYMPDDFKCIWAKDRNILQQSDRTAGTVATERLYFMCPSDVNISFEDAIPCANHGQLKLF